MSTRPGESSPTYGGSSQFAKHLGIERVVFVLKIRKLRPREAKRSVPDLRTVCVSGLRELRAFGCRDRRMSGCLSTSLLDLPQGPGPIGIQCRLPFESNLFYPIHTQAQAPSHSSCLPTPQPLLPRSPRPHLALTWHCLEKRFQLGGHRLGHYLTDLARTKEVIREDFP